MDVDKNPIPSSSQSMINRSFEQKKNRLIAENQRDSSSEESKRQYVQSNHRIEREYREIKPIKFNSARVHPIDKMPKKKVK